MPENLNFYVHDVMKPFPKDFHNQYDIVNIRFFSPVMSSSKVVPLLENFLSITSELLSRALKMVTTDMYLTT